MSKKNECIYRENGMNDYSAVQFNFTDHLRKFTIEKTLRKVRYVEEFGRKNFTITIEQRKSL